MKAKKRLDGAILSLKSRLNNLFKRSNKHKMTLGTVVAARKVLSNHADEKMTTKTAYKIMKWLKATEDENTFYNDKVKALIEESGKKDDDGKTEINEQGNYVLADDKIDYFQTAIKVIEDTETTLELPKFTIDEIEGMNLTVRELLALDEFITEE